MSFFFPPWSLVSGRSRRMNPHDACDALSNIRPYLEHLGVVYVHLRPNWEALDNLPSIPADEEVDYLDFKIGETSDIVRRRAEYDKCVGEPIIWCFYYPTAFPKLVGELSSRFLSFSAGFIDRIQNG